MVLEEQKVKTPINNFPTKWQTVIFRNYGFVEDLALCKVLECSEQTLTREAARLGLCHIKQDPKWQESGYITIIRNNWYLLGVGQLLTLLGFSQQKLDYVLKEEDFLWVKLGFVKPICERAVYYPLNEHQIARTQDIAKYLSSIEADEGHPFDFFADDYEVSYPHAVKNDTESSERIIHGYFTPCGDVFTIKSNTYLSDNLLKKYRQTGITGLWMHAVLSTLSPYPFKPELSTGYIGRREELKSLIRRCAAYGIKVYLYLNEPRCLPVSDFDGMEELTGCKSGGFASLCLGNKKVEDYLFSAVYDLTDDVRELGGIITITMSENLTHCRSFKSVNCTPCKVCGGTAPYHSAAKVNNIIMRAIKASGSSAELIANLWGWSQFMGWSDEEVLAGVATLDRDISVMCVSEFDLDIEKGGIKSKLIDYSISNPGPSRITKKVLKSAMEFGHKVYSKIQVNNSWECFAVPYIPVFDLVVEHLENLSAIGVGNYMLSWTLGGWPSLSLSLLREFGKDFNLEDWYQRVFGKDAKVVHGAVKLFCRGFREYPFSVQSLYYSPKNLGYANMWDYDAEEKSSTMVCYSFDDYEKWISPYSYQTYCNQYEKLLTDWHEGLNVLKRADASPQVKEMLLYAKVAYLHFESDLLHTRFSYYKRNAAAHVDEILQLIERSEHSVKELITLTATDAKVGYEASNHYLYSVRTLKERLINLQNLKSYYGEEKPLKGGK